MAIRARHIVLEKVAGVCRRINPATNLTSAEAHRLGQDDRIGDAGLDRLTLGPHKPGRVEIKTAESDRCHTLQHAAVGRRRGVLDHERVCRAKPSRPRSCALGAGCPVPCRGSLATKTVEYSERCVDVIRPMHHHPSHRPDQRRVRAVASAGAAAVGPPKVKWPPSWPVLYVPSAAKLSLNTSISANEV